MVRNRLLYYVVALVIIGCGVLFGSNSAIAGAIDLPKTGQTTCYDAEGYVISCEGTGQDGDIRAGMAWPTPRFTDNGDGTVSDNLTGIMWLKDADCFGCRDWESALRKVKDFNVNPGDYACWEYNGAYNDWVLPNVNELDSLNNSEESYSGTWLEDQGFVNVQQSSVESYWSSTTDASSANYWPSVPARYAWAVNIRGSFLKTERKDNHYYHIWPIRTGQTGLISIPKTGQTTSYEDGDDGDFQRGAEWPVPRFTDNGDGTVIDNLTGLMWLKGACFQNKTWQEGLDAISDFNDNPESLSWCGGYTGTYNDWRLPNKNELHSITDFSQYGPALPSEHPFLYIDTDRCWTSTTSAILEEYGWVVDMNYGEVVHYGKGRDFIAWPVRTGQTGEIKVPTITTTAVSSITSNSASSGGNVTSNGGGNVTAKGVCWSTSANPTTGDSKTTNGSGTGSFTSLITGLSLEITYHVRAYATNIVGTGYGRDVSFTTSYASALYVSISGDCGEKTPCYNSIHEAIDAASTGDQIRITQGTYDESLVFNESKLLTIQGGWDSTFTTQSLTTIINSMILGDDSGTTQIDNLVLQ